MHTAHQSPSLLNCPRQFSQLLPTNIKQRHLPKPNPSHWDAMLTKEMIILVHEHPPTQSVLWRLDGPGAS